MLFRNIIANFMGRALTSLMTIAFLPLYVHFLGIEAYGLIGFFATLQAVCMLLDLGLSAAINHGLAKSSTWEDAGRSQRDLVRTFAWLNWGLAAVVASVVYVFAPMLSHHWLNARDLDDATVTRSIQLMGLIIALRFPCNLYMGALAGLQRQISMNVITTVSAVISNVGALAVLALLSASVEAFFLWQVVAASAQALMGGGWLSRCLPSIGRKARFDREILVKNWRFAAGMSGIAALAIALTQADKLILSKMLSLKEFGSYALASSAAGALLMLSAPFFAASFPAFSTLVAEGDQAGLRQRYHWVSRLVSCVVFPPATVLAIFPEEVLWAWTGNMEMASATAPVLRLLSIGSAFNAIMNIPYALQLANGSTRLAVVCNSVAVVVQVPLVILGASAFGPVGAAWGWPVLNMAYVVLTAPLIHSRFLPGGHRTWLVTDTLLPMSISIAVVGMMAILVDAPSTRLSSAVVLAVALIIAYAATGSMNMRALWPHRGAS